MTTHDPLLYIAASYRHLHAVQMLIALIRDVAPAVRILDWTEQRRLRGMAENVKRRGL